MNRAELIHELLPALNKLFGDTYANNEKKTVYVKKYSYGKYSIYKYTNAWEGTSAYRHHSETIAKGLTKEEADGFMKLLKENEG